MINKEDINKVSSGMSCSEFNKLTTREKWNKWKEQKGIWACKHCGVEFEDEPQSAGCFIGEKVCCTECDGELTRRTNGGQSDPFNWILIPAKSINEKSETIEEKEVVSDTTLTERVSKYMEEYGSMECIPSTWNENSEKFWKEKIEAEQLLQRQKCAKNAIKLMSEKFPMSIGIYAKEYIKNTILTAGTEQKPQNPFGCACGWERNGWNGWWLKHDEGVFSCKSCNYCPKCGKEKLKV